MNLSRLVHPDLLKGNIFKSLVLFTLPLLVSNVFQQLYNAVDTMIVGHYLGEQSLAAIGSCTSLNDLLIGFGMGFGTGLSIVSARVFGSGDRERLKRVAAESLLITLAISLVLFVFTRVCLRSILLALGTPHEILDESLSYISTITIFSVVLLLYNLLSGLLRSIGNSFMPLIFLVLSSLLNIALDIVFITRFLLGVRGAAIATVIAQAISAVLCLVYILKTTRIIVPSIAHFCIEKKLLKELFAQGLSMACMGSLVNSGTVGLQSAINSFGTLIIAGHISARKIFSITAIPIMTLGMSSSTFVSQNYGAAQYERIRKGVKCAVGITIVWALLLCALMSFAARPLIRAISGSADETVLHYGSLYITFAVPFFLVLGALIVIRNSLQGMQKKVLPLISSVIELLGKVLFTLIIIPRIGTWGLILCEPLIWCVMTAQLVFVYVRLIRRPPFLP